MLQESSVDEPDDEEEILFKQNSSSLSGNDDLRELCVLLDEERHKMHELAEQWKEFGSSTIHKLECQIVDYQDKLSELEQRQVLLVKENDTLKSLINELMIKTKQNEIKTKSISIQTNLDKHESSHHSCFHRPKPIYDHLSRTTTQLPNIPLTRQMSADDPLQQQISIQNMFDAIRTAEVYESIQDMTGHNDESEKLLLKDFCNLIWKYLEDRSKPKSSCLL